MKLHEILDPENMAHLLSTVLEKTGVFSSVKGFTGGPTSNRRTGTGVTAILRKHDLDASNYKVELDFWELDDDTGIMVWIDNLRDAAFTVGTYDDIFAAIEVVKQISKDPKAWIEDNRPDDDEDEDL